MSSREWLRVTKTRPCPVCGGPDWCLLARDGSAAICPRTPSPKRCGDAGYLHKLGLSQWKPSRVRRLALPERSAPKAGFGKLADEYHRRVNLLDLIHLAAELGVDRSALWRLGIGWDGSAWTFPMKNAVSVVTGIRRRFPDGRKLSVRGGREGLFVPIDLPTDGPLFIAEGPTDTAALLTLGFAAIGRPSCCGGVRLVCDLARGRDVVIVADRDEPGWRGAEALAGVLALYCPMVRVIRPPPGLKDARQWVQGGATAGDVLATIAAAEPRRLRIETRAAGR